MISYIWKVPYFRGQFCPIFGQEKYEFLATTIITLFDENSLNQFYIRLCVKLYNLLYCLLLETLLKYILINILKNKLLSKLTHMRTQFPIMTVENSQTANDGRLKQSNFKYTTMVLL